MRLRILTFSIAALVVTAGSARAQFIQYTEPGGLDDRPVDRKTQLDREVETARFHLGALRVTPSAGLRNVAYVRDFFQTGNDNADFTATLSAGLRAYLRTGDKVVWVPHVLPEYVWWRERSEQRRVNQRFGLTTYGFFNRMTLEALAERDEQLQILTPELPRLVNARNDRIAVTTEVRPTGHFSAFARISHVQQENLTDEEEGDPQRDLGLLDREELVARTGVRWRPREGWMVGVGVERSQVEFTHPLLDASNTGTAPVLEALVDRRHFFVQLDVAARSLEARNASRFVDFDGVTGSVIVSLRPRQRIEVWTYANRNLVYSLSPSYAYLDDRRQGLAFEVNLTEQASVRAFGEIGTDDFISAFSGRPERTDDVTSYGGSLRIIFPGSIQVIARALRSNFVADTGQDRSYVSGGVTVILGRL